MPCQKASWVSSAITPHKSRQNSILTPAARDPFVIPGTELTHGKITHSEQLTCIYSINCFKIPSEGPYVFTQEYITGRGVSY